MFLSIELSAAPEEKKKKLPLKVSRIAELETLNLDLLLNGSRYSLENGKLLYDRAKNTMVYSAGSPESMEKLIEDYQKKVRLIFRKTPIRRVAEFVGETKVWSELPDEGVEVHYSW